MHLQKKMTNNCEYIIKLYNMYGRFVGLYYFDCKNSYNDEDKAREAFEEAVAFAEDNPDEWSAIALMMHSSNGEEEYIDEWETRYELPDPDDEPDEEEEEEEEEDEEEEGETDVESITDN